MHIVLILAGILLAYVILRKKPETGSQLISGTIDTTYTFLQVVTFMFIGFVLVMGGILIFAPMIIDYFGLVPP